MATWSPDYTLRLATIQFPFGPVTLPVLEVDIPQLAVQDYIQFGAALSTFLMGKFDTAPSSVYKTGEPINPWGFGNGSVTSTDGNFVFTTTYTESTRYHWAYTQLSLTYISQAIGCTLNPSSTVGSAPVRTSPMCLVYNKATQKWVVITTTQYWPSYAAEDGAILNRGGVPFGGTTSQAVAVNNAQVRVRDQIEIAGIDWVSSDPYAPGGITGPGGGDGTFDFSSTDIPIPALPTIGAYNTGFISLFRPSATELHSLASYMWSSAFDINNFIKIFADPGECILGLHIIPTSGTHPEGASAALMVGNISTGLTMTRLTEQYFECDCGTITISPKWGAYLDYSPYSKLSLYLPYIGFVPISPDDCMGGTIRVVYHVDALSGSCCAYVYCTSNRGADGHTLYTFTGSCACVCPVTEGQYTNGIIGSIRGGVGMAAGLLTGNIMGGLEDAANALISMAKPDVSRSGSFGGSAGLMGIQYPYLVLTVPKMATPQDQNVYLGYPSFITADLSTVTGYASIKITHLEGMSATDEEIAELVGILEEGVIM